MSHTHISIWNFLAEFNPCVTGSFWWRNQCRPENWFLYQNYPVILNETFSRLKFPIASYYYCTVYLFEKFNTNNTFYWLIPTDKLILNKISSDLYISHHLIKVKDCFIFVSSLCHTTSETPISYVVISFFNDWHYINKPQYIQFSTKLCKPLNFSLSWYQLLHGLNSMLPHFFLVSCRGF